MEKTAENLMDLLNEKVANNESISPAYWLEMALRVNTLSTSTVDNQVAHYEAEMNKIEAEYLKTDMTSAKAKVLARSQIDYEKYLALRSMQKRIENFLSTARRRAQINEL